MANVTSLKNKQQRQPLPRRIFDFYANVFRAQSLEFNMVLGITMLLMVFGLVMVLSASSIVAIRDNNNAFFIFGKQVLFAVIGFLALSLGSVMPVTFWRRMGFPIFLGSLFLQVLTFVPGIRISVNGNNSWIHVGAFSIQPAEFLKISMILLMSIYFERHQDGMYHDRHTVWKAFALPAAGMALVVFGKDLGTTLVIAMIAFALVWLFGAPGYAVRLPLTVAGIGVAIALLGGSVVGGSSRVGRISAWLSQSSDTANAYAWQSQHGIWALAAGHLTGVGLGMSKLKWSWIPEVDNDYIFAIIGEELGLLGALFTILLFLTLGYFLVRISLRSQSVLGRSVVMGVAVWITLQAMINIGVVLQWLPVLGVPLPLISSGGSSLIAGLAGIGICLSFERENHAILDGGRRVRVATERPVKRR